MPFALPKLFISSRPLDDSPEGSTRQAMWPMLAGVAAAWFVLDSLIPWIPRGSQSRVGVVIIAVMLLLVAVMVAGWVSRQIYRRLYRTERVSTPLVRAACLAALWVPAWVLFMETWSLLMIAAGALCLGCIGALLRWCSVEEPAATPAPQQHQAGTPFLFDDGWLARYLLPSLLLVLLFDAVIALSATRRFTVASIAAGIVASVLAWRATTGSVRGAVRSTILPGSRQAMMVTAAFVFTIVALLPYLHVRVPTGFSLPAVGNRPTPRQHAGEDASAAGKGYVGVILLPEIEKQKKILAPERRHLEPHFGVRLAEQVEIPFDGQYWYFKWPEKRPRPTARMVRGSSVKTQISASDRRPLTMEAHQRLQQPIDLGCCSAIALTVENEDQLPGAIALELWVSQQQQNENGNAANGSAAKLPPPAPHYLGTVTIPSSELPVPQRPNAHGKAPEERLSFPVPPSMDGTLFDEITVVVRPAPQRGHMGAKVAMKSFFLEP